MKREIKMSSERNHGIDLLRLVLMYMVCILHTLGQGSVLEASAAGTGGYRLFWLLEVFSYCAVDGFALISGYTASDAPRKYEKLIEMWFQAFFYSFIVTAILSLVGVHVSWGADALRSCLMPVSTNYFWYFTAFFVLYLAIPMLNRFLFAMDEDSAKKAFMVVVLLFSVLGFRGDDPFTLNYGYSVLWLLVLYCIGVLAKRIRLFEARRSSALIALWAACILLTWGVYMLADNNRLINYVSPTILLSALLMVVLFSRIKIRGRITGKLAPLAFGIYLFQLNGVIWNSILCNAFAGAAKQPLPIGIALVLAYALAIFLSGLLVEFVRSRLARLLRIPALSRKIAVLLDRILRRLFVFLK